MIELPEALTIAKQMNGELKGKKIDSSDLGVEAGVHPWILTHVLVIGGRSSV